MPLISQYVALTLASSAIFRGNEGQFHIFAYVSEQGYTLIDRELYLPWSWFQEPERGPEAGIPQTLAFQTKCELAQQMVERVWQAQIPIAWVVADTVYGNNMELRLWLEQRQYAYGLAVACDEPIALHTPLGRRQIAARDVEALVLTPDDWQRLSMSQGTKGPRLFDWALVPILYQWQDDGQHWLLIRRCVDDPCEKTYYLIFAPQGTTLPEMVKAIGARWRIEEIFEASKDLGLDHYEVRSFIGWYRHITLCMWAHAFLTVIAQEDTASASTTLLPLENDVRAPLTVAEVRHLLGQLLWPAPCSMTFLLAWSWWRRCHSGWASYSHRKRRREKG